MTKETIINDVAEYYFSKGFTVLSYDPRSIGQSDGQPRNESNPMKMMEDYMDALTFLKAQDNVDPTKIAYWGYSFSGRNLAKSGNCVMAADPHVLQAWWHYVLLRSINAPRQW
jgi:alpha/beta superfamily hydrolase